MLQDATAEDEGEFDEEEEGEVEDAEWKSYIRQSLLILSSVLIVHGNWCLQK